jgi:predicted NBD/HSP70 family sugar kinase
MYIFFDIGGTRTRVIAGNGIEFFGEPVKFDTPQNFEKGIKAIVSAAREVCNGEKVTAMAGGVRGILDQEKTMMLSDPGGALPDWERKPLVSALSSRLDGAPVYIQNDTAVTGLGEAAYGAGVGHSIVAYHTISTGVGGARIEDGNISCASTGFEPGHQILDIDGSLIGDGISHTLESLVSGSSLEKRRGVKAYEIDQSDAVWGQLAVYLARGLKNTTVYWSPDVIVLGGSMICGDPRILLEEIIQHTREVLADSIPCPKIVDAALGDSGGLYGAMAFLRRCTS